MPDSGEIWLVDFLHRGYQELREAWAVFLADPSRDHTAPGFLWKEAPEDAPITPRDVFLQVGELVAINAAKCVLHYLHALAKAYSCERMPEGDPNPDDWPSTAVFTLARGMLEATAVVTWLMDPLLAEQDRMFRAAQITLWSEKNDRTRPATETAAAVNRWTTAAEAIGFEVKDAGRWKVRVGLAGEFKTFGHSSVIRDVFGQVGADRYAHWSGVAHQAAWALAPWTSVRIEEDGMGAYSSTARGETDHLDLGVAVAEIVAAAGKSIAGYWGRGIDDLREVTSALAGEFREGARQVRSATRV
ncbi:hypothetical protein ABZU76_26600 [Amycolatopsis sp. NPDC005232]|uniref:hypothetical protein n=1 Tax=Amycolatopsis sp. NPDC005232 TaxID=3157027 RepID=UPI0033A47209